MRSRMFRVLLGAAILSLAAIVATAKGVDEKNMMHVVDCTMVGDRCIVHDELAFNREGMSDAEVLRQVQARRDVLNMRANQRFIIEDGNRITELGRALMCRKITNEEYRAAKKDGRTVEQVIAGDPATTELSIYGKEKPGCNFVDPACPWWLTYFNSPQGSYCMGAAVNCYRR